MTRSIETGPSGSASSSHRDALVRLTPFGWNWGLVVIVALVTASFFLAGYFVVYWRNADMDLVVVQNALALNDDRPLAFFDHPAYFTVLLVRWWFELLHNLGLLDAWRLSAIPSASNGPAFDAAMTSAVRAGRLATWLTATACILIFAGLIRRFTQDWRLATLATFAFAFSGGVEVHARIMRSEMIAASFFMFALMILMIVARQASIWRPLAIGGAAALCVLALENKIHVILLIAALPLLILPFGSGAGSSVEFWSKSTRAWLAVFLAAAAAALLAYAATPLIFAGVDPKATAAALLHPLLAGTFGAYQIALLAWIGICVVAFAGIWRVSLTETLTTIFLIVAGASLALLALKIQYNPDNAVVVINPLEKMLQFADLKSAAAVDSGGLPAAISLLLTALVGALKRYTFFLASSPRPTVFLIWLIVPGIVLAWRRGEWQTAIQAIALMMTVLAVDTVGMMRGLKAEYFVFTDPLIIIAGTVLLSRMTYLRFYKWAYPIGVALVAVHVGISQADPVKYVFMRSGPEGICVWNQHFLPLLPVPWCELPLKRP
jgi:hypothetical protein